jgi:Ni/Co efflux regulator RcnB
MFFSEDGLKPMKRILLLLVAICLLSAAALADVNHASPTSVKHQVHHRHQKHHAHRAPKHRGQHGRHRSI